MGLFYAQNVNKRYLLSTLFAYIRIVNLVGVIRNFTEQEATHREYHRF